MARGSSSRSRAKVATCFGVGYERIAPAQLCELLRLQGIVHVVDVRQSAWSYRQEYRKAALQRTLEREGFKYTHLPAAGNPYRPRGGEQKTFASCRRDYARFVGGQADLLSHVHELARTERVALLCYERDGGQCHRSVLAAEVGRRVGQVKYVDLQPVEEITKAAPRRRRAAGR